MFTLDGRAAFVKASARAAIIICCGLLCAALAGVARSAPRKGDRRLLVVTVTKGYRHQSIAVAERVIEELGQRNGWLVDFARTDEELRAKTTKRGLESYDAVIFANTSGVLPLADREAFLQWIRAGHAFIGIHAASDTFRQGTFPAYIEMLGGEFDAHDAPMSVTLRVEDRSHPATRHLGTQLTVFDEIYRICNFDRSKVHVLLALDIDPVSKVPGYFPLAWNRLYGKGRVFYTALGHHAEVIEADWFRQHLQGGIRWALGQERGASAPQWRGASALIECRGMRVQ